MKIERGENEGNQKLRRREKGKEGKRNQKFDRNQDLTRYFVFILLLSVLSSIVLLVTLEALENTGRDDSTTSTLLHQKHRTSNSPIHSSKEMGTLVRGPVKSQHQLAHKTGRDRISTKEVTDKFLPQHNYQQKPDAKRPQRHTNKTNPSVISTKGNHIKNDLKLSKVNNLQQSPYVMAMIAHAANQSNQPKIISNAGSLHCDAFHGPMSNKRTQEMVYWRDISSDSSFQNPFYRNDHNQYLLFSVDAGGWNNRRIAFETMVAYALSMGRILVLPPATFLHHPSIIENMTRHGVVQKVVFQFSDIFDLESIPNLRVITMEEFLHDVVLQGHMKDPKTNQPIFPPENRTNWDTEELIPDHRLNNWLKNTATKLQWAYKVCHGAFPNSTDLTEIEYLERIKQHVEQSSTNWRNYVNNPVPLEASVERRMQEYRGDRNKICIYNKELQLAPFLYVSEDYRTLAPFYSMTFFQDWRRDLWLKRTIRDHLRYRDEIQCAAARVVEYIRDQARKYNPDSLGVFDSIHLRHSKDFLDMFHIPDYDGESVYGQMKAIIPNNTTVYVATDEKDKTFFDPLRHRYNLIFLEDCIGVLDGVNSNLYGMVEQLVASRGRFFFAAWYSTFSAYITRLKGYHMEQEEAPRHREGSIPVYPYYNSKMFGYMEDYYPIKQTLWAREFPATWRLLELGL